MKHYSISEILGIPNGTIFKMDANHFEMFKLLDNIIYSYCVEDNCVRYATQDDVANILYYKMLGEGVVVVDMPLDDIADPADSEDPGDGGIPVYVTYVVTEEVTKTLRFSNDKDALEWIKLNKYHVKDIRIG